MLGPTDTIFGGMYLPDPRDREVFGELYNPPTEFQHGEWHEVARLPLKDGSDGFEVSIEESRLPARFFKVTAHKRLDYDGKPDGGFNVTTGSAGKELAQFVLDLAKHLNDGMIGLRLEEGS